MSAVGRAIAADVRVAWNALREEAAWAGVGSRRRRRTARRAALGAAVAAAVLAGVIVVLRSRAPAPMPPHAVASAGVTASPPAATAPAIVRSPPQPAPAAAPERVAVELDRGTRQFIADASTGPLAVHGGDVTVEATRAVFECSRSEHAMRVEVFRGSVLVHAAGQQHRVGAGEHGEFRDAPAPAHAAAAPTTWRDLARDGDYDRAYVAFDHAGDATEDLLMSADVMRLSHHPADAIEPLQRVVREHASDPRASLAAFTLGRVLLDELGRPRDAADAFADAIRLAPTGPLVEDALARQIEALSRAGEPVVAHQLAEDYVRRFPAGRKLHSVRIFGGLP